MSSPTADLADTVTEAVAEPVRTLDEAAYAELVHLWGDLDRALMEARDGVWSIACESITRRIVALTRTLGRPMRWEQVQASLLAKGVYQQVHDLLGMAYEQPDMEWVAAEMARRGGSDG